MGNYAEVQIELLSTDAGGPSTPLQIAGDPCFRAQFRVHGGDGTLLGVEVFHAETDPLPLGQSTTALVVFIDEPQVSYAELDLESRFDIVQNDKVVGTGQVLGLYGLDVDWQSFRKTDG
jgi:hypothetical protein